MSKSRAQQRLVNSWVDIVLTVVSIIQGLTFSDLAVRFPEIYRHFLFTGDWTIVAHFILCFALLFRIFQTYVTAALDYHEWSVSLFDLFVIFMIGTFEYFLFSCLDTQKFDFLEFHGRLTVISAVGLLGFTGALLRLHEDLFASYLEYEKERKLQLVNLAGIFLILLQSICILVFPIWFTPFRAPAAFFASLVLAFNTFYSIRTTFSFGVRAHRVPSVLPPSSETQVGPKDVGIAETQVRSADRADVFPILDLLLDNFGYVFFFLFETSYRLTRSILYKLLLIRGGRQAFGYKSFFVAYDNHTNKVVGLLLLAHRNRTNWFISFMIGIRASIIVLTTTGIIGLARTIRNLPIAYTARPISQRGELSIAYIAISKNYQHKGIGAQLVRYATALAQESGTAGLSVQVRENKQDVRVFFHRLGFSEDAIIESDSDATFGLGRQVRMVLNITSSQCDQS